MQMKWALGSAISSIMELYQKLYDEELRGNTSREMASWVKAER